jgi:6-phosphogluconolactonase
MRDLRENINQEYLCMDSPNMQIKIYKNIDELSIQVATWVVDYIQSALETHDRFTIALSGGNTPKRLFQVLASEKFKHQIDWKKMHVFWGDERAVSYDDKRNNAKMAYDELLDHVPIPSEQIHRMQTDIEPAESAKAYEKILRKYFAMPNTPLTAHDSQLASFDLTLLGLGDNAHTLSLFPGYEIVHEKHAWVVSFFLKEQNMTRITLTAPIVNLSNRIAFLVTGPDKEDALVHVLEGHFVPDMYPAQLIKPVNGELFWFLDEAAAVRLKK